MKARLIEILMERSVRHGTFTLASGKESDLYVDARQTTLSPEGAAVIADLLLEQMHPEAVGVGGPVTGAHGGRGVCSAVCTAPLGASFQVGPPVERES